MPHTLQARSDLSRAWRFQDPPKRQAHSQSLRYSRYWIDKQPRPEVTIQVETPNYTMASDELADGRECSDLHDTTEAHGGEAVDVDSIHSGDDHGDINSAPDADPHEDLPAPGNNRGEPSGHNTYEYDTIDLYGQDLHEDSLDDGDISRMLDQTALSSDVEPVVSNSQSLSPSLTIPSDETANEGSIDSSRAEESITKSTQGVSEDTDLSFEGNLSHTIEQVVDHYTIDDNSDIADMGNVLAGDEAVTLPVQSSNESPDIASLSGSPDVASTAKVQMLQKVLLQLVDDITLTADQHKMLKKENIFLHDYIGNLMATSKMLDRKK